MTKSRKRMLLSSVAMLLVALVALGSATFAWYITQDTVTANNAAFSASAAQGLEIKHHADGTWTNSINFNTLTGLSPASTNFNANSGSLIGGTGGTGTAYDDGTLTGKLTYVANSGIVGVYDSGSIYYDDAYVASSGSAIDAYTKISLTGVDDTYMVALVYVDGVLVGKYTSDTKTGAPTTTKSCKQDTDDTTKAVEDTTVTGLEVMSGNKLNVGTSFTAKAKADGGTHVEVVAFADGFNAKCTNKTAKTDGVSLSMSFKTSAWS